MLCKISQRVTTEFFLNSDNFQNSPKVAVGFGYFCNKICHLNLPKIAQSCHTGRLNTLDNTLRRRRLTFLLLLAYKKLVCLKFPIKEKLAQQFLLILDLFDLLRRKENVQRQNETKRDVIFIEISDARVVVDVVVQYDSKRFFCQRAFDQKFP